MKTSKALEKMIENLTPETWNKGSLFNQDGTKACLSGHVYFAGPPSNSALVFRYLERSIENEFGKKWNVPHFNDEDSSSFEDIMLITKKAYFQALEDGV